MEDTTIKTRLEYLRTELREERISYGELVELQSLAEHIEDGDVELLEAAGVEEEAKEYTEENDLFSQPEKWPENLKEILEKWFKVFGGDEPSYAQLNEMTKEVELVGYTFDYYLTAEPYNLRELSTPSLIQLIEAERKVTMGDIEDFKTEKT